MGLKEDFERLEDNVIALIEKKGGDIRDKELAISSLKAVRHEIENKEEQKEDRFWIMDKVRDNEVIEDWYPVVDEKKGGIIAYFGRKEDAELFIEFKKEN